MVFPSPLIVLVFSTPPTLVREDDSSTIRTYKIRLRCTAGEEKERERERASERNRAKSKGMLMKRQSSCHPDEIREYAQEDEFSNKLIGLSRSDSSPLQLADHSE